MYIKTLKYLTGVWKKKKQTQRDFASNLLIAAG